MLVAKGRVSAQSTARPVRENGKTTVKRLLAVGRKELQRSGPINFRLDRVLKLAKVSPSSLYHHFGNRVGLLTALEFEVSYSNTMRELEMLRTYIASTDDPDSIFKAVKIVFSLGGSPLGRQRRRHRVETLATASRNPALRELLADAQREGTEVLIEVLRLAMEKRRVTPRYPVEGLAYLWQSLLVGRVLVDLTDDDQLDKAWEETATAALCAVLTGN